MSTAPTEAAVDHAKSQLKAMLLLSLDSTPAIAVDVGRQVVTSGRRFTPNQIENAVEGRERGRDQASCTKVSMG